MLPGLYRFQSISEDMPSGVNDAMWRKLDMHTEHCNGHISQPWPAWCVMAAQLVYTGLEFATILALIRNNHNNALFPPQVRRIITDVIYKP